MYAPVYAAVLMMSLFASCTTPTVEYHCEGGRKVKVETHHAIAVFGVELLGTHHKYDVGEECDRDVQVGPK